MVWPGKDSEGKPVREMTIWPCLFLKPGVVVWKWFIFLYISMIVGEVVPLARSARSYNIYYNLGMDTRVRKIGNGYGILLPKQVMDEMRLEEGATLTIVTDANGLHLSPYDAGFSEQLEAFRRTESRHRNSYRELAK